MNILEKKESSFKQAQKKWLSTVFPAAFEKERLACQKAIQRYFRLVKAMEWDESAITEAIRGLSAMMADVKDAKTFQNELSLLCQQLQQVGSGVYHRLFQAYHSGTGKVAVSQAKAKLTLLVTHLGATLDKNQMLQLSGPYSFDPTLPPHATFWHTLATTVQQAYPDQVLADRVVHQLRMYIDRQNICYIRFYFKKEGMTDEQALAAYVAAPLPFGRGGRRMEREPARYHNKLIAGERYQDRVQGKENKKRTVFFHSEFIIDSQGCFVSQWNVLEKDPTTGGYHSAIEYYQKYSPYESRYFEEQIMNGESFNYANHNDRVHQQLDVTPPAKLDSELRKIIGRQGLTFQMMEQGTFKSERALANQQKKWSNPNRKSQANPEQVYDYFSDKGDDYSGSRIERVIDKMGWLKRFLQRKQVL